MIKLLHGDCIKLMQDMKDNSVDTVIVDPPYGTTPLKWDNILPFNEMWEQYHRVVKPNGAIVMFSSQPFTSMLVSQNVSEFKHEIIWEKQRASNFMQVKYAPLKYHENIEVFGNGDGKLTTFNPQKYKVIELNDIMDYNKKQMKDFMENRHYDQFGKVDHRKTIKDGGYSTEFAAGGRYRARNKDTGFRNPRSVVKFNKQINGNVHPTQKPVDLLEYLIKTYTNENDLVLDNCMGSGSTGVACQNLKRNFIGMELDDNYFKISEKRLMKGVDN